MKKEKEQKLETPNLQLQVCWELAMAKPSQAQA